MVDIQAVTRISELEEMADKISKSNIEEKDKVQMLNEIIEQVKFLQSKEDPRKKIKPIVRDIAPISKIKDKKHRSPRMMPKKTPKKPKPKKPKPKKAKPKPKKAKPKPKPKRKLKLKPPRFDADIDLDDPELKKQLEEAKPKRPPGRPPLDKPERFAEQRRPPGRPPGSGVGTRRVPGMAPRRERPMTEDEVQRLLSLVDKRKKDKKPDEKPDSKEEKRKPGRPKKEKLPTEEAEERLVSHALESEANITSGKSKVKLTDAEKVARDLIGNRINPVATDRTVLTSTGQDLQILKEGTKEAVKESKEAKEEAKKTRIEQEAQTQSTRAQRGQLEQLHRQQQDQSRQSEVILGEQENFKRDVERTLREQEARDARNTVNILNRIDDSERKALLATRSVFDQLTRGELTSPSKGKRRAFSDSEGIVRTGVNKNANLQRALALRRHDLDELEMKKQQFANLLAEPPGSPIPSQIIEEDMPQIEEEGTEPTEPLPSPPHPPRRPPRLPEELEIMLKTLEDSIVRLESQVDEDNMIVRELEEQAEEADSEANNIVTEISSGQIPFIKAEPLEHQTLPSERSVNILTPQEQRDGLKIFLERRRALQPDLLSPQDVNDIMRSKQNIDNKKIFTAEMMETRRVMKEAGSTNLNIELTQIPLSGDKARLNTKLKELRQFKLIQLRNIAPNIMPPSTALSPRSSVRTITTPQSQRPGIQRARVQTVPNPVLPESPMSPPS